MVAVAGREAFGLREWMVTPAQRAVWRSKRQRYTANEAEAQAAAERIRAAQERGGSTRVISAAAVRLGVQWCLSNASSAAGAALAPEAFSERFAWGTFYESRAELEAQLRAPGLSEVGHKSWQRAMAEHAERQGAFAAVVAQNRLDAQRVDEFFHTSARVIVRKYFKTFDKKTLGDKIADKIKAIARYGNWCGAGSFGKGALRVGGAEEEWATGVAFFFFFFLAL